MRFVHCRLAIVDASGVEADRLDALRLGEPLRCVRMKTWEMQLRDGSLAALGGAEVARGIGPETRVAGANQHDRRLRDLAVRTFPRREIVDDNAVVRLIRGLAGHVDHDGIANELVECYLFDRVVSFREVRGRVEVRTAVLRGREVVRSIVIALRRYAVGNFVEPEPLRRGPVDGLLAVVVREIDERSAGPACARGRARAGAGGEDRGNAPDADHGAAP